MISSSKHSPKNQPILSDINKALALPVRVAMLEVIAKNGNCCEKTPIGVGEIELVTIKHHLKALKKAGLIKGSLSKNNLCYCIDWDTLDEYKKQFDQLYKSVKKNQKQVTKHNGACLKVE